MSADDLFDPTSWNWNPSLFDSGVGAWVLYDGSVTMDSERFDWFMSEYGGTFQTEPLTHRSDQFEGTISYGSGMNRSDNSGKPRYDLMNIDMLTRWAELMARNVASKGDGNWRKAKTPEDLARCRESAFRHFVQWFTNQDDEDHAASLFFNVATCEYIKERIHNDDPTTVA